MVIALICIIPVMSIGTGYLVLKAYQSGLRHNFELKNNIKPSVTENPVVSALESIKEDKKEAKLEHEYQNLIKEYLYGEE